ncbi:type VI immunity family protein [Xenorhabdus entomophaga]|uniref:type VI immunity family protein n=1 Tax=Xenorhabdus entomophaga TaxID=3136257 RepID=UPI0030F4A126
MNKEAYFEHIKAQLTGFTLQSERDITVTRLGLAITLFFKQGYTREKKERILACYRRFREMYGDKLRFHTHEFDGLKKYSAENIEKVEQLILKADNGPFVGNKICSWDVSDARNAHEAPQYWMHYIDSYEIANNKGSSYLCLVLPWDVLTTDKGQKEFDEWLTFLCKQLNPDHGECGYTFVLPRDYHEYMPQEYQLAIRYPAIQVNSNIHMDVIDYFNSIRSIGWITLLSNRFIKRLGGEQWVRKKLSIHPDIAITKYSNGLIIKIDEYPDLTQLPACVSESYLFINELIRPIRYVMKEGDSLHTYGEGHFTGKTSTLWYARYDRGPLQVEPLMAGEPARVDGYWTTKGREGLENIILQGDIAPDVEGNAPGTTVWRLVRQIEHDDMKDLKELEAQQNAGHH